MLALGRRGRRRGGSGSGSGRCCWCGLSDGSGGSGGSGRRSLDDRRGYGDNDGLDDRGRRCRSHGSGSDCFTRRGGLGWSGRRGCNHGFDGNDRRSDNGCLGLHDRRGRLAGDVGRRSLGWRLCTLLGSSLLGRGFLRRLRFLRLFGPRQAVALGAPTDAVGLLLDDGGGMALRSDAHRVGEIHDLYVGHPELFGELVHPHVLRQDQYSPFVVLR